MGPALTVIVALDAQRARGELALAALLAQDLAPRMEVLLLDQGVSAHPPLKGSEHPSVRVLPIEAQCGYGEALSRGVEAAKAPVVAFVEEHVQVFPGWARALVEAHSGPWAAVCGELHPGDLGRPVARRIELVSRQDWSAPARAGEAVLLRWQNVSYKRDALLRYGDRLPLFLQSEGALFRQLRRDGERLCIEPSARMIHAHEYSWQVFLGGTFYSNRVSAASAARLFDGGAEGFWRPLAAALIGPLRWPLVLWRRTGELPNPGYWTPIYWRNVVYVVQYYITASAATIVGLLFGAGDSASRFLDFEVNKPRLIPPAPGSPAENGDAR